MRFRTILLAAAASFACAAGPAIADGKVPAPHKKIVRKAPVKHAPVKHASAKQPGGVSVTMDEVRVVTFQRPVTTVFVGNPTIADATVIDPYHVFVLGKTFGTTNFIALNAQSQTVSNQMVTVNRGGSIVTLNKGANQFSYSCASAHCETNPLPGDQKTYVEDNSATVSGHQDQAIKAATATASAH